MVNDTRTVTSKDRTTAMWSCDDEATLVRALKKAKDDRKWGDNNPKEVAWTVCVVALSGSETVSGGVAKDAKVVRRRWQRVSVYHISCIVCAFTILSSVEARI
jgi:hypothetical protein